MSNAAPENGARENSPRSAIIDSQSVMSVLKRRQAHDPMAACEGKKIKGKEAAYSAGTLGRPDARHRAWR